MRKPPKNARYYVHRIHNWPDGNFFVEVSAGRDSANPGVMGCKYRKLGEFGEFDDPREAAIAAVRVWRQWRKDSRDEDITLSMNGQVAGEMGIPGDEVDVIELFKWARHEYNGLLRCSRCGEIIIGPVTTLWEAEGDMFCGGYCVEQFLAEQAEWDLQDLR